MKIPTLMISVLLLAGCSAQQRREPLVISVLGSNTFEFAGSTCDLSQLRAALQRVGDKDDAFGPAIRIVAPAPAPYEWIHRVRIATLSKPRSGDCYLTTNASEPGEYFFDGSIGDSSTIWKSTEVNLEKGEFYLYLDEGRVARLDDPKAFWANTNYAHMAYIVASPTTTAQRLMHELRILNSCQVLPYIVGFNIFSDAATVEEYEDSKP